MTTDMAFECLLVSEDLAVVSIMNRLLEKLSISTKICPSSSQAVGHLSENSADLLILDWKEDCAGLLQYVKQSRKWRKPTVMVVSELESNVPGTYFLLRKPVTSEAVVQSLKKAYSRMLQEHRQHTRYTLTISVMAIDQVGRSVPITVTNIGEGGIGLNTKEWLVRGDVLSFPLLLPNTDTPIHIEARVLWTRQYGAAGCEFACIRSADLDIVYNWLTDKCQIKKPLDEL